MSEEWQTQEFLDHFNYWKHYRDPNAVDETKQSLALIYQTRNYIPPVNPFGLYSERRKFYGQPQPFPPPPPPPNITQAEADAFLNSNAARKLQGGMQNWKGVKILGKGGQGSVGLWRWQSTPNNSVQPRRFEIAIKESTRALNREARRLNELLTSPSKHIVNAVGFDRVTNPEADGLPQDWLHNILRIYMEYCPLGTMNDLLGRREQMHLQINERSLWHFFNCLVDGASMMQYGDEARIDPVTLIPTAPQESEPPYQGIIHFDLKPENILLADDRGSSHAITPICKIADFGLAARMNDARKDPHRTRRVGTHGFYPPEQFTARWDFADADTDPVAGMVGPETNIWQMGLMMYSLLTLVFDTQDLVSDLIQRPFTPYFPINGSAPKGTTYGYHLSEYEDDYSKKLRDLILECLYEIPANRPSVLQLKERVKEGIESSIERGDRGISGDQPEPWANFFPGPPQGQIHPQVPAAPFPQQVGPNGPLPGAQVGLAGALGGGPINALANILALQAAAQAQAQVQAQAQAQAIAAAQAQAAANIPAAVVAPPIGAILGGPAFRCLFMHANGGVRGGNGRFVGGAQCRNIFTAGNGQAVVGQIRCHRHRNQALFAN